MFGISMWELVLILLVALILLGPRQLTDTARVVGRLYRELLKLTSEVKETINLDSLANFETKKYDPPPPQTDLPRTAAKDQELVAPPGEKIGPDFYADLLEQSAENPDTGEPAPEEEEKVKKDYAAKDKDESDRGEPEARGQVH